MDFNFSPEHLELTEILKGILKNAPATGQRVCPQSPQATKAKLQDQLEKLAPSGYLKLGASDAFVNCNLTAILEVVAQACPDLFIPMEMSTRLFGRILWWYGTSRQKEEYLDPIHRGIQIGAVAVSEKTLNIENTPLETWGEKQGDTVSVTGKKSFVVNGPFADCFAVVGQMENRPAVFLIPKDSGGLTVGDALSASGDSGILVSFLTCHDCAIPLDHVIVPEKPDLFISTLRLWENQILSAAAIGTMVNAFSRAKDFSRAHQSGGKPILAYQEISFKLATLYTLIQAARMIAWSASSYTHHAQAGDASAITQMHCAKVFCAESAEKIVSETLQILGAHAWTGDAENTFAYWSAKYTQIAGTSTELARVQIGDAMMMGKGN